MRQSFVAGFRAARLYLIVCVVLAIVTYPADAQCTYEVTDVIAPPKCSAIFPLAAPIAISPNGRYVVGYYRQCDGDGDEAFVYDTVDDTIFTVPRPQGVSEAAAWDVNDAGLVVGHWIRPNIGARGFIYDLKTGQHTQLLPLSLPGDCYIRGVNATGVVCGSRTATGAPYYYRTAFTWSSETGYVDLGLINGYGTSSLDINESGTVVGTMSKDNNRGFIWNGGNVIELGSLAGLDTVPWAVNNHDQVVGSSKVPAPGFANGVSHAFMWENGVMVDLGTGGQFPASIALSITDSGVVAGGVGNSGGLVGAVWQADSVQILHDVIVDETEQFIYGTVNGSSEQLQMVCMQYNEKNTEWISAVISTTLPSLADLDFDCLVNVDDLVTVLGAWGQVGSTEDLNSNGVVDLGDVEIVLTDWSELK